MKLASLWLMPLAVAAVAGAVVWGAVSRSAAEAISRRPELITKEAEQAIEKGLLYLSRTQASNGSWRSNGSAGQYPTPMTSLAGLALLASGSTPVEGPHAGKIRMAVDYLIANTGQDGLIASPDEQTTMHGHGFAMLFLSQAYGMERDEVRRETIRKVLVKAVELTEKSQSRDGGWLYTPNSGGDEGSVTVTQIQGLRGIRNAGIKVPKGIIERAADYIHKSANPDGGISYRVQQKGTSLPAITAAAVATLYNAGEYEHPVAKGALDYLKKQVKAHPGVEMGGGHKFYMLLYAGQGMYLSSDENWTLFFPQVRDELVKSQNRTSGSWQDDPTGEVFSTSIALLTLQLPYKYLPILQR